MGWTPADVYEIDTSRFGSLKKATGVWRGVCEYNADPRGLGRIKVRVPAIHGASFGGASYIDTTHNEEGRDLGGIDVDALPWAWPCTSGSGGVHDAGSFDIPLVGASVWVMFEQGNPDYPIWLGTWPSIPEESQITNYETDIQTSMGPWKQTEGLTTPQETHNQQDPQVRVLAKTPKGGTIIAIDTDESETLMIIDRAGQMIEMYSPVTSTKNEGNASQRGLKTARNNNSLDPLDYGKDNKAYIRIIDTSYQTTQEGDRVWSGQYVKLSAEAGNELVRVHGACGHDILLDSSSSNQRIVVKDNIGNFIFMSSEGLKIKSKSAEKISIEGNVELDVKGSYTVKTSGNYTVNCDQFIVNSNNTNINATNTCSIVAKSISIDGTSSIAVKSGGSLAVSTQSNYSVDAGGTITEAGSTHTTKASSISHIAGSGSPSSPSSPSSPEDPGDPAGDVSIPTETFPIG